MHMISSPDLLFHHKLSFPNPFEGDIVQYHLVKVSFGVRQLSLIKIDPIHVTIMPTEYPLKG